MNGSELFRIELESTLKRWIDAGVHGDVETYRELTTESFVCVTTDGLFLTKDLFLEDIRLAQRKVLKHSHYEALMHFYKDMAVLNFVIENEMLLSGFLFKGPIRATATWIRDEKGWKCAAYHSSDIRKQVAWNELKKKGY